VCALERAPPHSDRGSRHPWKLSEREAAKRALPSHISTLDSERSSKVKFLVLAALLIATCSLMLSCDSPNSNRNPVGVLSLQGQETTKLLPDGMGDRPYWWTSDWQLNTTGCADTVMWQCVNSGEADTTDFFWKECLWKDIYCCPADCGGGISGMWSGESFTMSEFGYEDVTIDSVKFIFWVRQNNIDPPECEGEGDYPGGGSCVIQSTTDGGTNWDLVDTFAFSGVSHYTDKHILQVLDPSGGPWTPESLEDLQVFLAISTSEMCEETEGRIVEIADFEVTVYFTERD
jgi:hypothetical protein